MYESDRAKSSNVTSTYYTYWLVECSMLGYIGSKAMSCERTAHLPENALAWLRVVASGRCWTQTFGAVWAYRRGPPRFYTSSTYTASSDRPSARPRAACDADSCVVCDDDSDGFARTGKRRVAMMATSNGSFSRWTLELTWNTTNRQNRTGYKC